mgnify:CR=1 FL=1
MSAEVQWAALRNNHSFLVKRDGITFSAEPNNLMNVHSFKFSGLANNKTVGVKVVKGEKSSRVVVTTKRTKNNATRKPRTQFADTTLRKHVVKGTCVGAAAVNTLTAKSYYRADLSRFAIARYHALTKSLRIKPDAASKKRELKRKPQK